VIAKPLTLSSGSEKEEKERDLDPTISFEDAPQ
jgi:hypothetical protein